MSDLEGALSGLSITVGPDAVFGDFAGEPDANAKAMAQAVIQLRLEIEESNRLLAQVTLNADLRRRGIR